MKAALQADIRYAYTVDHWSSQNGNEIAWKARFDPRRSAGEQWSPVGAALADLDKSVRKALGRLQEIEKGDDQLVYEKLGDLLESAVLQKETEAEAVFVAPVEDEELPEGAMEAVITLNKVHRYVSQIEVRSVSEFKPHAMVKPKSMNQSQHYAPPLGDGPAFLAKSEAATEGKAMFKKFSSESPEIISEIETVDSAQAPARQD